MADETFHCDECDRDFKTHSALISHQKTHLSKDDDADPAESEVEQSDMPVPDPEVTITANLPDLSEPPARMPVHEILANAGITTAAAPTIPTKTTTAKVGMLSDHDARGMFTAPVAGDQPVVVKLKKLDHYEDLPDIKRATPGSAAFDLYAAIPDGEDWWIPIGTWKMIPTGLCMEVPPGFVAKIVPRSGLAAKNGITLLNTPGIIDSDYRGEVLINLVNNTTSKFKVNRGMRIAQMMIERVLPVEFEYVDELSDTERGEGGFGSTGTH